MARRHYRRRRKSALNPRHRRRRIRRRRSRGLFGLNPPRRRYRRRFRANRRYRRNPVAVRSIVNELTWTAGGFIATKLVGNMISPMLAGIAGTGPLMRIASKLGIAYLTAWGVEQFMGRRAFMPVMIGGSVEVIQDVVRTFISPMIPALAAAEYPLEVYYEPPPMITDQRAGRVGAYEEMGSYLSM